jgi:hypothetical protein
MKHKVKLSFLQFAAVEIKCTAHRSIVNAMEHMHINEVLLNCMISEINTKGRVASVTDSLYSTTRIATAIVLFHVLFSALKVILLVTCP